MLIAGLILALLTLFLFVFARITGNVLVGYTGIASLVFVLPVAAVLFVVGLGVMIVSGSPEKSVDENSD